MRVNGETSRINTLFYKITNHVHLQMLRLGVGVETDQAACVLVYRPVGTEKWLHLFPIAEAEPDVAITFPFISLGFGNTVFIGSDG